MVWNVFERKNLRLLIQPYVYSDLTEILFVMTCAAKLAMHDSCCVCVHVCVANVSGGSINVELSITTAQTLVGSISVVLS